MKPEIVGILLAGGLSKRFGRPKAFASKDSKHFYQFSLEALQAISNHVIIVTNEQLENKFKKNAKTEIIKDRKNYQGKGPLAGIYTAMEHTPSKWYAVAPVDTPFIKPDIFKQLFAQMEAQKQAILAVTNDRLQPLLAFYHYSLKETIKELLDTNQLALKALLKHANTKYVSFADADLFININLQSDYNRYIKDRRLEDEA